MKYLYMPYFCVMRLQWTDPLVGYVNMFNSDRQIMTTSIRRAHSYEKRSICLTMNCLRSVSFVAAVLENWLNRWIEPKCCLTTRFLHFPRPLVFCNGSVDCGNIADGLNFSAWPQGSAGIRPNGRQERRVHAGQISSLWGTLHSKSNFYF